MISESVTSPVAKVNSDWKGWLFTQSNLMANSKLLVSPSPSNCEPHVITGSWLILVNSRSHAGLTQSLKWFIGHTTLNVDSRDTALPLQSSLLLVHRVVYWEHNKYFIDSMLMINKLPQVLGGRCSGCTAPPSEFYKKSSVRGGKCSWLKNNC